MRINQHLILKTLSAFVLVTLLSSCGFKPRGSGYEFLSEQKIVLFSSNPYGELERIIKTTLAVYSVKVESSSTLNDLSTDSAKSTDSTAQDSSPAFTSNAIQINDINFDKKILSVDVNGRPAEYETTIVANVSLLFKDAQLDNQVQHQLFSVQRDYRYDNNNSLADDRELEKLVSEMYEQLAHRIVAQFSRQLLENNATDSSL